MLDLREYRRRPARLADFLPWAALVAPGVVLNKDGSFQRTAEFRGPDLDSATDAEVAALAGKIDALPAGAMSTQEWLLVIIAILLVIIIL